MKNFVYSLLTGLFLFGLIACSDVPSPYEVYNPNTVIDDSIKKLPYTEAFTSSQGDFTIINTAMPEGLSFVWTFSNNYSCMKASGYYNSTNYVTESWLMSPPIDLTGDTAVFLSFEHSTGYLYSNPPANFLNVMVSKDYTTGDPSTATWQALTVANWYTGTSFEFVESGLIDLSSYVGESNVHIAFKYTSNSSTGPTWEVKNMTLSTDGGSTPEEPDPDPAGTQSLPYSENFTASQGGFSIENISLGSLSFVWAFSSNYSCMKGSGYYNGNNNCESWLISPPITLENETAAFVSFDHSTGYLYSNEPSSYLQLMVSKDYESGAPSTATWSELTIPNWYSGTTFEFVASGSISLSSYLGESNVHIAFKYTGTTEVAPTWEIQNFLVSVDGTGGGEEPDPEVPETGEGSKDTPYSVAQAQTNQGSSAWVKGYIVGWVNGTSLSSGATFGIPSEAQTEILISDDANTTDYSKCMPIQLPAGALRTALNLFADASLLKKSVILYGSLETYFGTSGMKATSCAIIDGTTYGTDPTGGEGGGGTEPDLTDALFSETFSGGQGAWTTSVVQGTEDWEFSSYGSDYYAKMSAYNATGAQESWLISPAINLTKDCTFTFDVCVGYWTANCLSVLVTNEYEGDVDTAWETLSFNIPQEPASGYGAFVSAGTVSLSSYTGSSVRIAFQYSGNGTGATTTYEVTNVIVK